MKEKVQGEEAARTEGHTVSIIVFGVPHTCGFDGPVLPGASCLTEGWEELASGRGCERGRGGGRIGEAHLRVPWDGWEAGRCMAGRWVAAEAAGRVTRSPAGSRQAGSREAAAAGAGAAACRSPRGAVRSLQKGGDRENRTSRALRSTALITPVMNLKHGKRKGDRIVPCCVGIIELIWLRKREYSAWT